MTKVKICGLKNQTDIKCINTLSPDFAGFVMFFEKSHRNISPEKAQKLLSALDPNIKSVAVTVSPTEEQLEQIHTLGFDYVQIHGKISEKLLSECKTPVIRAINVSGIESIGDIENLDNVTDVMPSYFADLVLKSNGNGGNGKVIRVTAAPKSYNNNKTLNTLNIKEGRLPEKKGEILVEYGSRQQ